MGQSFASSLFMLMCIGRLKMPPRFPLNESPVDSLIFMKFSSMTPNTYFAQQAAMPGSTPFDSIEIILELDLRTANWTQLATLKDAEHRNTTLLNHIMMISRTIGFSFTLFPAADSFRSRRIFAKTSMGHLRAHRILIEDICQVDVYVGGGVSL